MTPETSRSRWPLVGLFALACVLYLGTAGTTALVDDDVDAAHALVAREMLERSDYAVMYMDGIRYLIRPPVHFWLVAASYAALGESEFATRLPVALAMIALVLLTYEFGRRFFSGRAALCAALAVATSAGMFIFTRTLIPEAIYALEFLAIFYLFLRSWTGSLDPRLGYWGAAAVFGLAVLTRGPIGLLFPAGALIAFLTLTRGWGRWRELRIFSSAAIFLAVAAPWHVVAGLRAPGFFWAYFINEHVNRALGTRLPHDYSAVPLWLWWLEHIAWLFPWSLFAPLALRGLPSFRSWARSGEPAAQARVLLWLWAGVILLFFTVESGSRMEYYSFGAWPAMALLLGAGMAEAELAADGWLHLIGRGLAVLGTAFLAAAGYVVWGISQATTSDFSSSLRTRSAESYQSSMAHMTDLTPAALSQLRFPVLFAAGCLFVAFVAAWLLLERRIYGAATLALALGMAGFFFAADRANRAFEPSLSSRAVAMEINRTLRPDDRIALYGDIRVAPGIAFYCRRRVLLYNATGSNLEFGSHYPDAPKTFLDDQEFGVLWGGPGRVILVVPATKNEEVRGKLAGRPVWTLTASGGKTVYVNQPPEFPATSVD